MTKEETSADQCLYNAKDIVKRALRLLDPSPRDPITETLLRILDDIDVARKKLKDRFS
jgi:hypothetical protein